MKKIISILLTLILLTTPLTTVNAASTPFTDVSQTAWYAKAIEYVYQTQLFKGTGNNTFSPNTNMTRAMFVTVLANMTNKNLNNYTDQHFLDVNKNAWYAKQVEWAALHGIVSGTGKYKFSPNNDITREQIAVLLYRYAEQSNDSLYINTNDMNKYTDKHKVSDWAYTAINWAVSNKIITGTSQTTLNPKDKATRAQAAQIFYNSQDILNNVTIPDQILDIPKPDEIDFEIYNMSLDEKIGQLFIARYPDTNIKNYNNTYHPAGYTFYAKDIDNLTKQELINKIQNTQNSSKTPLFIAVDEEGGTVVRISSNKNLIDQPFESPQDIYKQSGLEGLRQNTEIKSQLLNELGFNLNFAPVCDISTNPNDYIYKRTLGLNAQDTATAIQTIVETMNENNMLGSLKHFPGYGNNVNTHTGISIDNRPIEQFETCDLIPFIQGIESNAPSVMISHNIVTAFDDATPASLSKTVHDYLRNELNFTGIIMTDDVSMDAIKIYTNGKPAAVQAILAGNDIILTSNLNTDFKDIKTAVQKGTLSESRIEESIRRTLGLKHAKQIM